MGDARTLMDRATEAAFENDPEAFEPLYAADAVVETPQGSFRGPGGIGAWFGQFAVAFPDAKWVSAHKHETGDTAIDEGHVEGTHTGPLAGPDGDSIPPTGKRIMVRGCDAATVENGVITSHRFYFDQMELLTQLGLVGQVGAVRH